MSKNLFLASQTHWLCCKRLFKTAPCTNDAKNERRLSRTTSSGGLVFTSRGQHTHEASNAAATKKTCSYCWGRNK